MVHCRAHLPAVTPLRPVVRQEEQAAARKAAKEKEKEKAEKEKEKENAPKEGAAGDKDKDKDKKGGKGGSKGGKKGGKAAEAEEPAAAEEEGGAEAGGEGAGAGARRSLLWLSFHSWSATPGYLVTPDALPTTIFPRAEFTGSSDDRNCTNKPAGPSTQIKYLKRSEHVSCCVLKLYCWKPFRRLQALQLPQAHRPVRAARGGAAAADGAGGDGGRPGHAQRVPGRGQARKQVGSQWDDWAHSGRVGLTVGERGTRKPVADGPVEVLVLRVFAVCVLLQVCAGLCKLL